MNKKIFKISSWFSIIFGALSFVCISILAIYLLNSTFNPPEVSSIAGSIGLAFASGFVIVLIIAITIPLLITTILLISSGIITLNCLKGKHLCVLGMIFDIIGIIISIIGIIILKNLIISIIVGLLYILPFITSFIGLHKIKKINN